MKKNCKKVLNIVVTLMAAIALMLGNVTSVAAYTALNGYVVNYPYADLHLYNSDSALPYRTLRGFFNSELNGFYFESELVDNVISNFTGLYFTGESLDFYIPVDSNLYDYYLVGTVSFDGDPNTYSFEPEFFNAYSYSEEGIRSVILNSNFTLYDYYNTNSFGKSFSCKLDLSKGTYFAGFDMFSDFIMNVNDNKITISCSIIPIEKSSDYSSVMNSILNQLVQINQNIITGNTLQQQTIDAINQNTTNTSNWFTTLITTMQGWYNTQTENLRTWFYMIEERMSAGFTALYHQMTKEQDEKLNGYEDTTQSDAANEFSSESDKLTELEGQLNDQSHGFVSDYTSTGFDTGVLSTISSSLIFVTTWFANFWNMGGIFTAGLNFCFSLSIVFFILRLRR